jgi:hypothetical protein
MRPPRVLGTREIGGAGFGAGRTRGRSRHLLYSTPTTAPTTAPSSVITRTAKSTPHRASATSAAKTSSRCRAYSRNDASTDPRGCEFFTAPRRFAMTPSNPSPSCEERLASPSHASNRSSWSRRPTPKRRCGAAAAVATWSIGSLPVPISFSLWIGRFKISTGRLSKAEQRRATPTTSRRTRSSRGPKTVACRCKDRNNTLQQKRPCFQGLSQ